VNLMAYLVKNRLQFEFIEKQSTHHASEAARAVHLPLANILKTLVFIDENSRPVVAIVRADRNVSRHKLEAVAGCRSLKLASEDTAMKVTGYPTGGIPPVGHKRKLPVFMDKGVLEQESMWCGGGTRTRLVKLKVEDVVRLNEPVICDIAAGEMVPP